METFFELARNTISTFPVKIRPLMDGNTRLIHLELEFEHIEILLEKNAKKGQNKINEILKDIINKLKNKL